MDIKLKLIRGDVSRLVPRQNTDYYEAWERVGVDWKPLNVAGQEQDIMKMRIRATYPNETIYFETEE